MWKIFWANTNFNLTDSGVLLNGQTSKWLQIKASVPPGLFLEPLLFLVYINDSPEVLTSNVKLFADHTSIFSVVRDSNSSSLTFNEDVSKISQWGYKWKMLFDPDASKQAQEIVFSRKKILLTITTFTSITCRQKEKILKNI